MSFFDDAVLTYAANWLIYGGSCADFHLQQQFQQAQAANSQAMANEAAKRYAEEFEMHMATKVTCRVIEEPILLLGWDGNQKEKSDATRPD